MKIGTSTKSLSVGDTVRFVKSTAPLSERQAVIKSISNVTGSVIVQLLDTTELTESVAWRTGDKISVMPYDLILVSKAVS